VVSSCHSRADRDFLARAIGRHPELAGLVGMSFGIHPQLPVRDEWDCLVELAGGPPGLPRLVAIGECGFDFWLGRETAGPRSEAVQIPLFLDQLALARQADLGIVIHSRRATELVFSHVRELKKLRSVVFHAWPAPPEEGRALLRQGVNAWFSLGTPLLQGKRSAIHSVRELPPERLLLETDAPYQTLKGQAFTGTDALAAVCREAARLCGTTPASLAAQVAANFGQAFAAFPAAG
jgi:TatD DNase family protein